MEVEKSIEHDVTQRPVEWYGRVSNILEEGRLTEELQEKNRGGWFLTVLNHIVEN